MSKRDGQLPRNHVQGSAGTKPVRHPLSIGRVGSSDKAGRAHVKNKKKGK